MYIWIDDIYSSTSLKQRLWQTKMNGFDITKFISSKLFVALRRAVVKELLARADEPG